MPNYNRPELLRITELLGREFARRRMEPERELLRRYYVLVRHQLDYRGNVRIDWTADMVEDWLALLRVPPFADRYRVASGRVCPRCGKTRPTAEGGGIVVQLAWSGGWKLKCRECDAVWVALNRR